jgi:hypothetical protein
MLIYDKVYDTGRYEVDVSSARVRSSKKHRLTAVLDYLTISYMEVSMSTKVLTVTEAV